MKKSRLLFLVFTTLFLRHSVAQTTQRIAATKATYANPLPVQFGDPYILYTQGTYYLYGTGGGADKGFAATLPEDFS